MFPYVRVEERVIITTECEELMLVRGKHYSTDIVLKIRKITTVQNLKRREKVWHRLKRGKKNSTYLKGER